MANWWPHACLKGAADDHPSEIWVSVQVSDFSREVKSSNFTGIQFKYWKLIKLFKNTLRIKDMPAGGPLVISGLIGRPLRLWQGQVGRTLVLWVPAPCLSHLQPRRMISSLTSFLSLLLSAWGSFISLFPLTLGSSPFLAEAPAGRPKALRELLNRTPGSCS